MKLGVLRMTPRERERICWLIAIAILAAGYFIITRHYEGQIGASTERAQTFYEKTTANHRLIAQSGRVRELRGTLRARLDGVLFSPRRADATAALLRDIDGLAHQHHAQVIAITPQGHAKQAASAAAVPSSDALANEAVDISVRGHFSDLLRFVAQLPRQHVLLRISQVNFALSGARKADSTTPVLDAKIHTLIYHPAKANVLGEI